MYARLYFFSKKTAYHDVSLYMAFVWLAVLISINIGFIIGILGYNPIRIMNVYMYALCLFILVSALLYVPLIKGKKYKSIINRYENESRKNRIIGYVILSLYVIATHITIYYISPNFD